MMNLKKIEDECLKKDKITENKEIRNGKKGEINLKIDRQIGKIIKVLMTDLIKCEQILKNEDKNFKIKDLRTSQIINGEMMRILRKILQTNEIHLIDLNNQTMRKIKVKVKIKINKKQKTQDRNKMKKVLIIEF